MPHAAYVQNPDGCEIGDEIPGIASAAARVEVVGGFGDTAAVTDDVANVAAAVAVVVATLSLAAAVAVVVAVAVAVAAAAAAVAKLVLDPILVPLEGFQDRTL